jgi:SUKH-3 immunity protein
MSGDEPPLDRSLNPSPRVEALLRSIGWSPGHVADTARWVQTLSGDGNNVFPIAEAILRRFGGVRLEHKGQGGVSRQDFEVDPTSWYGEREYIAQTEDILGQPVCPLGEVSGGAMLAVVDDGRVIADLAGEVVLLGNDWRSALDHLVLGEGDAVHLSAE